MHKYPEKPYLLPQKLFLFHSCLLYLSENLCLLNHREFWNTRSRLSVWTAGLEEEALVSLCVTREQCPQLGYFTSDILQRGFPMTHRFLMGDVAHPGHLPTSETCLSSFQIPRVTFLFSVEQILLFNLFGFIPITVLFCGKTRERSYLFLINPSHNKPSYEDCLLLLPSL